MLAGKNAALRNPVGNLFCGIAGNSTFTLIFYAVFIYVFIN